MPPTQLARGLAAAVQPHRCNPCELQPCEAASSDPAPAGKGIATAVISSIINKAFDYLKDNKKDAGLKSTKKRLEVLVPQIQVVFDAVDADQIRNQSEALDAWLWQLRDAVEEAEDALDELEYYRLDEKVKMRDNKVSGSFNKFKGRFVQQFNHAFNTGSLERLRIAVKTLDDAVSGVERFLRVLNHIDNNQMKNYRQAEKGQSLRLNGLEETDLLVLLNSHAFFNVNPDDHGNQQQISKQMAGKLCGSPLAAKVLGGLLNSKRDSGTWNRILASSTAAYFIKTIVHKERIGIPMDELRTDPKCGR
ncbi:hypothetical protein HU200_041843 [Digitaria exilis]|uniref:Disease resistance N-terminal domain-containing protein n=1 Tax=Digitaria exilis TaxID=1010633 RepID=A0A835EDF5_9POAL|nr:hypothetical protein HU200_041843 [Digitaria exilis]